MASALEMALPSNRATSGCFFATGGACVSPAETDGQVGRCRRLVGHLARLIDTTLPTLFAAARIVSSDKCAYRVSSCLASCARAGRRSPAS